MSADSFDLVRLKDGSHTLRDRLTGETFHPVVGPMIEARAIHIAPLQLARRLKENPRLTLWDVGLGAAANAIALLENLRLVEDDFEIVLVSFDQTLAPARFALEHAEALDYPMAWRKELGELLATGATSIRFDTGKIVEWIFVEGDFTRFPPAPVPDAVIYDPYSPAKNAAMWSLDHFTGLRRRLPRPAVLTSYSRSTAVRVTLLLAGFFVGTGNATGEKEETTLAATDLVLLDRPLSAEWLQRVRRSTKSAPLGNHPGGPIPENDWQRLLAHPQFFDLDS